MKGYMSLAIMVLFCCFVVGCGGGFGASQTNPINQVPAEAETIDCKAKFKTAVLYEKSNQHDIAMKEYVELSEKYPNCECIPEVMSRMGGLFQIKGMGFKEQADTLRQKTDAASRAEVLRLDEQSYLEFMKAAITFDKVQQRFPDHNLAGLAALRSAQNYMRIKQYEKAITIFKRVSDNKAYDGGDIRAQAFYWMGLSYERMPVGDDQAREAALLSAYQAYRRLIVVFPDSKWAKFARGRLADLVFEKIVPKEERTLDTSRLPPPLGTI
jgi:TolA-binding protein